MAEHHDVLICGSGSAGLAAATWLSRYGVRCKILEKRETPMEAGQADGLQARTVEIFESLGLLENLMKEAYHASEMTFWSNYNGEMKRTSAIADTAPNMSHHEHVILNQARVNALLVDSMKSSNGQVVDYGYEIQSVSVDPELAKDHSAHAVTVVALKNGKEETFKARYVLGCEGAHSMTRRSLGIKMVGDSTNSIWGVMDIYPRTRFPDLRKKLVLHSDAGTLYNVPREGGSLTRFYIQMPEGTVAKDVKLEDLYAMAQKIFAPKYEVEFADVYWWSAYSIGQRLADRFHQDYRVFLTGDACHTHSPKAGQGMNVSFQDGYNIGWKLGSYLTGQCTFDVVETYVVERAMTAAALIQFDRDFTALFAKMHRGDKSVTPEYLSSQVVKNALFTAGLAARYDESAITTYSQQATGLARNLSVGMRFPSTYVTRFCNAQGHQFLQALQADGKWRLVIFPGDPNEASALERLEKLADFLGSDKGLARSLAGTTGDIDTFIEPVLVFSGKRKEIDEQKIPDYFWPETGKWKMRDLHKMFVDDEDYHGHHGHAYDFYGVCAKEGAIVILRPDQYISKIVGLEDYKGIADFFDGFAIKA